MSGIVKLDPGLRKELQKMGDKTLFRALDEANRAFRKEKIDPSGTADIVVVLTFLFLMLAASTVQSC